MANVKNEKVFVVADYTEFRGVMIKAMFESNDFRLKDKEFEEGTFLKTKAFKGAINGQEIGLFTCKSGKLYLVFPDYSVALKPVIIKD